MEHDKVTDKTITRYRKFFGVGPRAGSIGLCMLVLLWLLDRSLGHVRIMFHPLPIQVLGAVLLAMEICWHLWCIRTIKNWKVGQAAFSVMNPLKLTPHGLRITENYVN